MTDRATHEADDQQPILATVEGRIGVIELNRPKVFNCLSQRMLSGIRDSVESFEREAQVRAVVIVAAGPHFCTGAMLDEVDAARTDTDMVRTLLSHGHAVLD